jgi:glycosyltransferase involved in cell wall biosynthesis
MNPPKVLIIGYVWPEIQSSAAGLRSWNLIETFLKAKWDLIFASGSKENAHSQKIQDRGVPTCAIQPNDSQFDSWIKDQNPDFVIFDRFVTEEQFGWRVEENCPNTIRIIDTQDLHFLRRSREQAVKDGLDIQSIQECDFNLVTETTLRELAAIYRSDASLILSDFEMKLLLEKFHIPKELLLLSRFHYKKPMSQPEFEERSGFVMIGNFRHPPNLDGVFWFHEKIWPRIRNQMPDAQVSIFGAYPPKSAMQLNQPKKGFHVLGQAEDQFHTLRRFRVNLAPLRFGAGIKGKVTDGWWSGTPVVSTPIGSEGMHEDLPWGGEVAFDEEDFAQKAVRLHQSKSHWNKCQERGLHILRELYCETKNSDQLISYLHSLHENRSSTRSNNIVGAILRHQSHRSTKYFSKWIEEKNKGPNSG